MGMIRPMSHDRSKNHLPNETPPTLHAGFFQSIFYTAVMLIGVAIKDSILRLALSIITA